MRASLCGVVVILTAVFAACAFADEPTTEPSSSPTTKAAHPIRGLMQHHLDVFDADLIHDGDFHHTTYDDSDGLAVVHLRDPKSDYPFVGTWSGPTVNADFSFTELLPSWNVLVPDLTGVRFDVRVRDHVTKDWSPWLYIGYWGRVLRDKRELTFDGGKVDADTLELSKPADAYELRATLEDFHDKPPTSSPSIRRMSVVYSRPMPADAEERGEAAALPATIPASVDLSVPFRAQGWEVEAIRRSICSPTSVSMVLAWAGANLPTDVNALAIWDDDNAIFGNWNRAVQYAGSLGFDAHLERFNSMDQARAMLASGQPIIASIRFTKGTFPSNLQKETEGHLIVLRGYDTHGDFIVNDPASKDHGNGVVYKSDELANAWLVNTGGVAYVIKKK